jgi:hypothetical protein
VKKGCPSDNPFFIELLEQTTFSSLFKGTRALILPAARSYLLLCTKPYHEAGQDGLAKTLSDKAPLYIHPKTQDREVMNF